ncbi:PASTA domain-containing protein, partial [Aeromonas veronii]|uniref:PASTA domain-containing protein n=1 Tax=Aeromonas veronii TaxID=654 RepID=UPI0038B5CC98
GDVTLDNSDDVDAGLVLEQDPGDGEYVTTDTEIDLVVSAGPAEFPMPDDTDKTTAAGIRALVEGGVARRNISLIECDTDDPKG